ncbi:hypothetical protein EDD85DRAFT_582555 [Armillaria nabsnona]|nr:hypothetical protein EDD85DRAFT_582555 [Armillaria nabsnona]
MASVTTDDVLLIIVAIILPPIAVILMKRPLADILINIILTLFFWIGGVIHALYLMYQRRKSWWRWYRNSPIDFTTTNSGQAEILTPYVVNRLNRLISRLCLVVRRTLSSFRWNVKANVILPLVREGIYSRPGRGTVLTSYQHPRHVPQLRSNNW